MLMNQGRHAEAERLLREELEVHRETLGERHLDTLRSMESLARVLWRRGEMNPSETRAGRAGCREISHGRVRRLLEQLTE